MANFLRARRGRPETIKSEALAFGSLLSSGRDGRPTPEHRVQDVHLYNQGASRKQNVHCKQRVIHKDHPPYENSKYLDFQFVLWISFRIKGTQRRAQYTWFQDILRATWVSWSHLFEFLGVANNSNSLALFEKLSWNIWVWGPGISFFKTDFIFK